MVGAEAEGPRGYGVIPDSLAFVCTYISQFWRQPVISFAKIELSVLCPFRNVYVMLQTSVPHWLEVMNETYLLRLLRLLGIFLRCVSTLPIVRHAHYFGASSVLFNPAENRTAQAEKRTAFM